ncbi:glycoside hydrolase family 2 protein [Pelagicoccus mobilis]|uniref:Beta-galactosidase n=1 Tax=Pelagicoccus mobilis TaxID=415221 RepID=A0A934RZ05_9BACT|nr:glycoside hydrolase family 2 TIM barrel-domain containing protein [Pelagicoccus mobilis]MBK1878938.1 hypothetical protein [Pelagicoccus mobilis]
MRKIAGILIFITLTIQSASSVELSLSLDGDWKFADKSLKSMGEWDVLPVPASWNTFTEYADYIGDAWYERTFTVPRSWKGKRIYLKFDAVYDIADVWCNGEYLGQHTGGYTPFEFDVTEVVDQGKEAELLVKVNNEHVVGAWFQWGGINRSVSLFAKEELRIIRQKIEPILDLETGTTQLRLVVTVENRSNEAASVQLEADIEELPDVSLRLRGRVESGEQVELSQQVTLNTEQTRLWHFDDPQLYHLQTTLYSDDESIDYLADRFGIRSIVVKPDGLYLNGEKVRLMGYNRVHDHRAYGNTEPLHLVRSDIDMMKRSGANFSRIMHAPSAPELLDYCDEVGYLLWCEIPMWQPVYRVPMGSREDAKKSLQSYPGTALREMIQRDWNHPSIIGWSPGNELRQEASYYVEEMRPFVLNLDSTRLYANIHDQGFSNDSKGGWKGVDAHSVDVMLINKYGKHDTKINNVLSHHEKVPQLPIFYSEFGETRSESLNHMVEYRSLWERLGKEEYVIGGAHWTFNDYRSLWTRSPTPHSQNRDWGAVDIWRNPKTLYYHFAEIQQPVRSIDIEQTGKTATVSIVPRGRLEIPSFTLRDYSWTYELLDEEGRVLEGQLRRLDTIEPDSEAVVNTINWETESAKELVVSLVSKIGYTVAERRYDLIGGEYLSLPSFPAAENPEVRKVLPLDRSFMVGVTSLDGDTGLEVRYGTASGRLDQVVSAPVRGGIRVRGLENGRQYFGQIRRIEANGLGPWSPEFQVVPDGGLVPSAPEIFGVVLGESQKAVRFKADEKVSAYRVALSSGEVVSIEFSNPGLLIVPLAAESVAAVGEYGVSEFSKL